MSINLFLTIFICQIRPYPQALCALTPTLSHRERQGEGVREVQFQSPLSPRERGLGGEGTISQLAGINRHIPEALLQRARELRQQQTPAEKLLWQCLRNRQLLNAKFRRQHNIGRYIADFYCHEARLVIELDGSIHQTRKTEDSIRDDWMQKNGFIVLRFTNQEVFNNTEQVLYAIVDVLTQSISALTPTLSLREREQENNDSSPPSPYGLGG